MSLIDYILNLFKSNKKNAQIYANTLQKAHGEKEPLEIGLYEDKKPITNAEVSITINGVKYNRKTDNNGIARLNINLNTGQYQAIIEFENDEYHRVTAYCDVIITEPKAQPTISTHYGYWVFGRDMLNVNLSDLKNKGVTDLFLNYYAFTTHGKEKVLEWIKKAKPMNVHIWVQCFYDGEWHNPKTTDLTDKINEIKSYAGMSDVYGIHLDYVRYTGNAYKTNGGTEAVTQFVKQVKEVTGNKFLSCAVMPEDDSEYYYGQDISALGKIVNVIIPMQYKGNYNAGNNWLASTTKTFSSKATIWSGLQSYKSDDDTTVLSESELKNDAQICLNNGAKGVMLFRYGLTPNLSFNTQTTKQTTRMEGTDINMTYKDGTRYQCAVYDEQNNRIHGTVDITVNNVTYNRKADTEGLYKLAINLEQGTYPIRAEYHGNEQYKPSYVNNTIKINPKVESKPKPSLNPYLTNQGCSGMGQCTGYYCACNSVQQCIYRLTGEHISESTLASVGGTTSDGTGHDGINTMIAWFNRNYDYNLKIQWKNFSEVGYSKLQEYIDNGAVFLHLLYRDKYGHYEVPKSVGSGTITVLNSLGDSCGGGTYCGYIETRNQPTQTSYINGISQKSVCIITRGD